tara:strand:+ start:1320 stop:1934 length:615 start_codon:yes stop_codon:yes gene_type:complete
MLFDRRKMFTLCGALIFPNIFYGRLTRTPWQGEGPFYPDKIPKDIDNDLVKKGINSIDADGKILILNGILLNPDSQPVNGVFIEIWQTDKNGIYLHSNSFARDIMDKHFQGIGRTKTNLNGRFFFRTIIPTAYPGRTPHIHMKLWKEGKNVLTTQLYIKDHPKNKNDFLFQEMSPEEQRLNSMELISVKDGNTTEFQTFVKIVV